MGRFSSTTRKNQTFGSSQPSGGLLSPYDRLRSPQIASDRHLRVDVRHLGSSDA